MMIGFACNETPEMMPLTISLAHQLVKRLAAVRKDGTIPYLGPDGKSQVTVEYAYGKPVRVDTVVISTQHLDQRIARADPQGCARHVIEAIFRPNLLDKKTKIYINPTGRFVVGGPLGDAGLTGRKIIVDTYGGIARHGGGAFSGKDPTKVDRSAAYAARYVAKNLVAAGLAERLEMQTRLCHRRRASAFDYGRDLWHGKGAAQKDRRTDREAFRFATGGDHSRFESAPTDLSGDGGVRTLWAARH